MNKQIFKKIDIKHKEIYIEELREIIHRTGGKIFLAHPFHYRKTEIESLLENVTPYIDGI